MVQVVFTPSKDKPTDYKLPETLDEKAFAVVKPTQPFELTGTTQVFDQEFSGYQVVGGEIKEFYSTGFTRTTSLFDALGYGLGITPFGLGLLAGCFTPLPNEKEEKENFEKWSEGLQSKAIENYSKIAKIEETEKKIEDIYNAQTIQGDWLIALISDNYRNFYTNRNIRMG